MSSFRISLAAALLIGTVASSEAAYLSSYVPKSSSERKLLRLIRQVQSKLPDHLRPAYGFSQSGGGTLTLGGNTDSLSGGTLTLGIVHTGSGTLTLGGNTGSGLGGSVVAPGLTMPPGTTIILPAPGLVFTGATLAPPLPGTVACNFSGDAESLALPSSGPSESGWEPETDLPPGLAFTDFSHSKVTSDLFLVTIIPVPEPSSLALGSLAAVLFFRRRRA